MSLVYPRSVPGSSLLQNKRDSFETSFVDYLVIKHHSSTDGNPYSYIGNSGNYGGNSVLGGGAEAEGSLKNTIYLYLPPRLQEQYSTNYQRTTVGAAGVQALDAAGTAAAGRWLGIPDYFRLDIIRIAGTPSEDGSLELSGGSPKGLKRIMQFPTKVVLKNMNINLSPDGPYNSLKDAFDSNMDYGPASFLSLIHI